MITQDSLFRTRSDTFYTDLMFLEVFFFFLQIQVPLRDRRI